MTFNAPIADIVGSGFIYAPSECFEPSAIILSDRNRDIAAFASIEIFDDAFLQFVNSGAYRALIAVRDMVSFMIHSDSPSVSIAWIIAHARPRENDHAESH